jgi:hypothetical protein
MLVQLQTPSAAYPSPEGRGSTGTSHAPRAATCVRGADMKARSTESSSCVFMATSFVTLTASSRHRLRTQKRRFLAFATLPKLARHLRQSTVRQVRGSHS